MKMLGLPGNPSQTIDGFTKSWDTKYQIPKLSARSSANDKDTSTTTTPTVATSPLSIQNQDSSASKSMMSFMSNVHSFTGNQMLSNKIHGRASSVSPKYNLNPTDGITNFNKDIHIYKSSSSDALQHQSQSSGGHHKQNMSSFSNPTTPTLSSTTSSSSQPPFTSSSMSFSHQLNNSNSAFVSVDSGDGNISARSIKIVRPESLQSTNSMLPNKSPMHHSTPPSMSVPPKNLLQNTSLPGTNGLQLLFVNKSEF